MEQSKNYKGIIGLIRQLLEKLFRDEAIPFAYQLAYSLLLSIFPFLLFLITLVGFLNLDADIIIEQLSRLMPGEAFVMFEGIIRQVTGSQNTALLSISIFTAIWSAAGGFKAFITAMNHVHGLKEDRSILRVNLDAIILVLLLALAITASLLLMVFAQPIINLIRDFVPDIDLGPFSGILFLTSYIAPLIFIFLLFLAFYMFVPARNVKFRHALPGAVFAALAFMTASLGFRFYVNNFGNYNRFYGAMGAVIILMFWLLLIAIIMVVGGEMNSILILRKGIRSPFMRSKRDAINQVSAEAVARIKTRQRNRGEDPEQRI